MWLRMLAFVLALGAMVLTSSAALAGPDPAVAGLEKSAARHFADGQKAFTAGDFPRAGDAFEAAYRDRPHHAPLWNAARSWQRAGEEVRAANLYARYLREAPPDAPDRDQATSSLRTLQGKMGRIELHAAGVDGLRLDGRLADTTVVYVAPGEHVAEADDKGARVRKVVSVRAGEMVSVTLAHESSAPAPAPVVGPPRRGEEPAIAESRRPLPPAVVVIGGVLTVVAGGLAVASGLDTIAKRDAFPAERTQTRLDEAFASQSRTNVLIGTTVGLGVVTGVLALFFTDWNGSRAGGDVARHP